MDEGKILLIANPAAQNGAGSAAAERAASILRAYFGEDAVVLARTAGPRHASEIAERSKGCSTVIALGGDGVIHEAANGIMRRAIEDRPAFGIIPVGSGNDYARALGISANVDEACAQLFKAEALPTDVGWANGRWFVESLSFGLDAAIALDTVDRRVRTGRTGTVLYMEAGIDQVLHHLDERRYEASFDEGESEQGCSYAFAVQVGPFYGGGFELLGLQLLGVLSVCAWTAVTITLAFLLIKAIFGLRVSREEEIAGLDIMEHGLASGYADFMPATSLLTSVEAVPTVAVETPKVSVDDAVPVVVRSDKAPASDVKMTKVSILCKQSSFEVLKTAMEEIGVTGMTVSQVLGCGMQKGRPEYYRGVAVEMNLLPKVQVDIVVCKIPVRTVIDTAKKVLYSGHIGDGKIFVYDVENVIKVRTGEEGYDALQDVE